MALWEYAKWGDLAAVQQLLAEGADVHVANDRALRLATEKGYVSVVEALLAAGANVHASTDEALRRAASLGYDSIVKTLLQAGADIEARGTVPEDEFMQRLPAELRPWVVYTWTKDVAD